MLRSDNTNDERHIRDCINEYSEFVDGNGENVVFSNFIEYPQWNKWRMEILWPEAAAGQDGKYNWRGRFMLRIRVFKFNSSSNTVSDIANASYVEVMTLVSSTFRVFSKPDVYTKRKLLFSSLSKKTLTTTIQQFSGCPSVCVCAVV